MQSRQVIALDLDDVINNLVDVWIDYYNMDYKDTLKIEDIKSWDIGSCVKPICGKDIFKYVERPDFFSNLGIRENALNVLERLNSKYDLAVTTSYKYDINVQDKMKWITKNVPIIVSDNIMFVRNKGLVRADFLVDDGVHNLRAFHGEGILYSRPWNAGENDFIRVSNWDDIEKLFMSTVVEYNLVEGIRSGLKEYIKSINKI